MRTTQRRKGAKAQGLRALFARSAEVGRWLPARYDVSLAKFQERFSDEAITARKFAALKESLQ